MSKKCALMLNRLTAFWSPHPYIISVLPPLPRIYSNSQVAPGPIKWWDSFALLEDKAVSLRCKELAERWAGDLAGLAALRDGLRARVKASPLCDAPRFARNLEAAYRRMWRKWCETNAVAPVAPKRR